MQEERIGTFTLKQLEARTICATVPAWTSTRELLHRKRGQGTDTHPFGLSPPYPDATATLPQPLAFTVRLLRSERLLTGSAAAHESSMACLFAEGKAIQL